MNSSAPVVSAYAPGRVELLGNHTDYNSGVVLGAAIDRGLGVRGVKGNDERIAIKSVGVGDLEIDARQLRPQSECRWANYVLGVASELRALGASSGGFNAEVDGDLPVAAGLASSAALELATALFLLKLSGQTLPPLEIAKACQRAEHRFVGVQSGLLDQVTSLFGKKNSVVFFDCRTEEVRAIPFPDGLTLIIVDSGRRRELSSGQYNQRRQETRTAAGLLHVSALRDVTLEKLRAHPDLPDTLRRRATHIVGENERVWHALSFLEVGDCEAFGRLMNESHESSRRNFENSTPELDSLVVIAQSLPAVLGARLTGAGFGGAAIVLCERNGADEIAREISDRYLRETGIHSHPIVSQIADGAR